MTFGRFKFCHGVNAAYLVQYQGPFDPGFRPLCELHKVVDDGFGKWVATNDQHRTSPCRTREEAVRAILGETLQEVSKPLMEEVARGWETLRTLSYQDTVSEAEAEAIYQILMTKCRAGAMDREHFVDRQSAGPVSEWRFCGVLGFGGKFYRAGRKWYVGAYSEDTGPEAQLIIAETNRDLLALYRRFRVMADEPVLA